MSYADDLTRALSLRDKAQTAYETALAQPQYVQTGQRRMATHDLKDLLAALTYWRKEVARLDSLVNGGRSILTPPLRYNL